jgi:tetratricopeptide (TPR) repeat protein
MSDREVKIGRGGRLRPNHRCPCGSGRKFKVCCGRSEAGAAQGALSQATGAEIAGPESVAPSFGRLTEVSGERRAAERFHEMQAPLPPSLFAAAGRRRSGIDREEAARHRRRGLRFVETGRLAAAIAAFDRATTLDPADAAAYRALGRALLQCGRWTEAIDRLQLAITLEEDASAFHDLAQSLQHLHRYDEAIAAYRRAIAIDPGMAEAHMALAELLEDVGDDAAAAEWWRCAAASLAAAPDGRLSLAKAAMLGGEFETAATILQEAVATFPEYARLHKLYGDALARLGRFEDAVAAFDRAIDLNPYLATAHFAAVEAHRCTEADRPRIQRLRAALDALSHDDEACAHLHFALGKLYDDLGEYADAMRHFDAANLRRRPRAHFDGPAFEADIERLVRRFTPEFFAANRALGADDETPLLIVGMPRSGTTLVEQILARHPQIAAGGELPYWITRAADPGVAEAGDITPADARAMAADYLALLRGVGPDAARVTDKLPFNVLCLGLVHLLLPKARIIQCRRHPADTCLSIYFTNFRQAIAFAADKADIVAAYREYARLMDHWRTVLPAECLLEVEYERLVVDREAITRQMIAFCGLEWDEACLHPEENRRAVTTASLWQARQPVYTTSTQRWRRYEPWLGELRRVMQEE